MPWPQAHGRHGCRRSLPQPSGGDEPAPGSSPGIAQRRKLQCCLEPSPSIGNANSVSCAVCRFEDGRISERVPQLAASAGRGDSGPRPLQFGPVSNSPHPPCYGAAMTRSHNLTKALLLGLLAGISVSSSILLLLILVHGGGGAFFVFYKAGGALDRGLSPYHAVTGVALNQAFVYLPWVAVMFQPIARWPFGIALYLWVTASGALALLSTWVTARALGWHRWVVLVSGVGVSSVLWRCLVSGQMDGIALAMETLALICSLRRRYSAAGAMSVAAALLKPQVLWLLPVLLLFRSLRFRQSRHFLGGALVAGGVLVGVPAVLYPQLLFAWVRMLLAFSSSLATIQPDLAGLPGLLRFAPPAWGLGPPSLTNPITLLLVGAGVACVVWLMSRVDAGPAWARVGEAEHLVWSVMLPMGVWFLVSPYSHSNDILVLVPLLVVALGRNGRNIESTGGVVTVTALVVLPELFLFVNPGAFIGYLSVASLAVLVLVIFAWNRSPWRAPSESQEPRHSRPSCRAARR